MVRLFWKFADGPFMPEEPFPVGAGRIEAVLDDPLPEWCPGRWKERYHLVRVHPQERVFWTQTETPLPLIASNAMGPDDGLTTIYVPAYWGNIYPENVYDTLDMIRAATEDEGLEGLWVLLCAGQVLGQIVNRGNPGLLFGPADPLYSWPALDWLDWYERISRDYGIRYEQKALF